MIRGLGSEALLTYSQTLNRSEVRGCLIELGHWNESL
jgi:hypothetical protein